MCGITGAVWADPSVAISQDQLRQMTQALAHRGPDGAGYHWQGNDQAGVALGHRRLSIIDLSLGQQPMTNEDDSVWVVFNGEIYNYRELRNDLISRGHRFRTECDTEVLVHLYEEQGAECVQSLRGMFAFAIWDQKQQRLFLARDRFGQKPLHYRVEPQRLLFASELKSLFQLPELPRQVNPSALEAYLAFQYVPAPESMFAGFQKLLPGHTAIWQGNRLQVQRYWRPPFDEPLLEEFSNSRRAVKLRRNKQALFRETVQQLRKTLTEAVRLRLRSDVPLGSFLSGGLDSTIITGLMQQELAQPVETYAIGFEASEYDERNYARQAAEFLGTKHHETVVTPSALDYLPKLIWHYEEPFADSSAIPTMALCQVTRQSVTVALTGDGGDELFAGYDRYRAVELAQRIDSLPRGLRGVLTHPAWSRLPTSIHQKSFLRRLKRFQTSAALRPEIRYLQWISQFQRQQREELFTPEFQRKLKPDAVEDRFEEWYQAYPDRDFVTRTTAVDQLSYLPGDILTKVDIASMSVGLECRSPFLDHRVAELAARLPMEFKRHGKIGKWILRETFSDLVPPAIMHRRKMGFGVPVDHWFRRELRPLLQEYLLSDRMFARGYFRPEAVKKLVEEHTSSQVDHCYRLWSLLVLEAWHRLFIDGETIPAEAPLSLL